MNIERNKAWMSVLRNAPVRNNTLVAVGAAHLAGRNGLTALLRSEGFEMTLTTICEVLNVLVAATRLRRYVQKSCRPKAQQAWPRFEKRLSGDLEITRHGMRLPERKPQNFGTPLSTLLQILGGDGDEDAPNQS